MELAYWILGAIAGLILLLALDFKIGRKHHLDQVNKKHFPIRNSNLNIFTHGPELFTDYFDELRQAKHHIHVLFYIVKNDTFSKEFLSILQAKAKDGVEVRLMVDWVGATLSRKAIRQLRESGAEFAFSRKPSLPFLFYTSQVRNHRKITIIDGKIGYTGGFNIGKEYIDLEKKLSPWRDYHLKVTGEGVQDLQTEFLLDWKLASRINLLQNKTYFPELEKGGIRQQFLPSEGQMLEDILFNLIQKAEKSIFIGTPYFIPSRRIFEELLSCMDKGIKVKLLVPFKADHILVKEASYPYLRVMIKHGAEIHQYQKGFYHAKVMVIDDKICDIGTANFDQRSMFLNLELNCLIYDQAFISKVNSILRQDLLDSESINQHELNGFNPFRSMKERAARTVSYFL
ncbi:cardiolipin synthase [Bacillus sp. FJAT-27251]|uniref:cardiolipin synthase n=1 Tax=Bacillus sp. FJAT-27251 TaxID=1684142 RepID=UPI0006A7EA26|nr:cardiolipin synthase [Bacillus sp. FJAT-27251]